MPVEIMPLFRHFTCLRLNFCIRRYEQDFPCKRKLLEIYCSIPFIAYCDFAIDLFVHFLLLLSPSCGTWRFARLISAKSVASAFVSHKKGKSFTRHHSGSSSTLNLIPWTTVLQKITVSQLIKKFSAFYGTSKFITVYTNSSHLSQTQARCSQSEPSHRKTLRSISILYFHPRICQSSGIVPSGLPIKPLCGFLFRFKALIFISVPTLNLE